MRPSLPPDSIGTSGDRMGSGTSPPRERRVLLSPRLKHSVLAPGARPLRCACPQYPQVAQATHPTLFEIAGETGPDRHPWRSGRHTRQPLPIVLRRLADMDRCRWVHGQSVLDNTVWAPRQGVVQEKRDANDNQPHRTNVVHNCDGDWDDPPGRCCQCTERPGHS